MEKSIYDVTKTRNEKINFLGFNYEGKIFKKTMSNYLFRDPKRNAILMKFESIVFFLIEKVKTIKTYYNFTVDKNTHKIN